MEVGFDEGAENSHGELEEHGSVRGAERFAKHVAFGVGGDAARGSVVLLLCDVVSVLCCVPAARACALQRLVAVPVLRGSLSVQWIVRGAAVSAALCCSGGHLVLHSGRVRHAFHATGYAADSEY